MTATVPTATIVLIVVAMVLAFAVPILLAVWLAKKKGAHVVPFLIGCGVFLVFALILESCLHNVVLRVTGDAITGNIWLYALYGGLAAGVFEETGRFLAMKYTLKKYRGDDANALMYGAGHGGFEWMMIGGIGMVNSLIYAVLINTGGVDALYGMLGAGSGVSPELMETAKAQIDAAVTSLTATPSWMFALNPLERVLALVLQLSFSVLVWFAVKTPGKGWLFPLAIALHAVVDGAAVIVSDKFGALAAEAVLAVLVAAVVLFARHVWKQNAQPANAAPSPAEM